MLIAEPGTAAHIRIQLIQSRPVVSDAVIGMVALSRLLANEVNRRFKDVLEEIKREQAKTRALIEELERKIEQLEHEKKQELESLQKKKEELLHQIGRIKAQAEKLKRMAEKIQEILPRLNELLAADTKSTPTRACVSARICEGSGDSKLSRVFRGRIDGAEISGADLLVSSASRPRPGALRYTRVALARVSK
jgi:predicted nuclease with TOPRIM domain